MRTKKRVRRSLFAVMAVAATVAAVLGRASSALAATCPPPPTIVHPFLPWNDSIDYVRATNGSFEPIAKGSQDLPWSLSGGATIVSDNEPWHVTGSAGDSHALSLPAGAQATSACTTAPNMAAVVRFFIKSTGASTGTLHVEIIVNGGKNGILDGGTISAGSTWQPTDIIYLPWAKPLGGAVDLRVRLIPVGAGASFEVDDVYIDPCVSR
jgi:hypothetical protein